MGQKMKTNLTEAKQNEGPENGGDNSTTVVIIRQDSTSSSKSTNFNSENEGHDLINSEKKDAEFGMSQTTIVMIQSYGQLDIQKRYVSEKEVDTRIGIADATTIADQCIKESKGTQYEPQKLNPESLRRAINSLTNSNFLETACEILENELKKRNTLDTKISYSSDNF